jgi:ATP-binding cassette, subfamily B, bacterial CvaB/MchF/RaxB
MRLLSGGQQKRVLLAQALYQRPRLPVMDEGTAHLDVETMSRVNESLSGLSITRIVATYRRETIMAADQVVVLREWRFLQAQARASQAQSEVDM